MIFFNWDSVPLQLYTLGAEGDVEAHWLELFSAFAAASRLHNIGGMYIKTTKTHI